MSSPEPSLLPRGYSFLFISFRCPPHHEYRWYAVDLSNPGILPGGQIPLPVQPFPSTLFCAAVSLGHSLYLLGGLIGGKPSPIVQIYDARLNHWRRGPDMSASRECAHAGVISGKIYVIGGCLSDNEDWAEEFDLENEQWRRVPSPHLIRGGWMKGTAIIGGKLLALRNRNCVVFDPAADKAWSEIPRMVLGTGGLVAVVGGVLYFYDDFGRMKAYDFTNKDWRVVEGNLFESLLKLPERFSSPIFANLNEVLYFLFKERQEDDEPTSILCYAFMITPTITGGLLGSINSIKKICLGFSCDISIQHCISLEYL